MQNRSQVRIKRAALLFGDAATKSRVVLSFDEDLPRQDIVADIITETASAIANVTKKGVVVDTGVWAYHVSPDYD